MTGEPLLDYHSENNSCGSTTKSARYKESNCRSVTVEWKVTTQPNDFKVVVVVVGEAVDESSHRPREEFKRNM